MSALATLDGAHVLVTGASSGIGAALAPALAARGATVGVVARRADRLDRVLEACAAAGPGRDHRAWVADLADPDAATRVALDAWGTWGGFDALVNNAGRPMRRHVRHLDVATVEEVMRLNFLSPVAAALAVLPLMLERGGGVIVNVSSLGGRLGIANEAAYVASKFALSGWTEAMAVDLWSSPVGVRLITPGPVDTEIWDQPGNDRADYDGPLEPPETVAEAICEALLTERFETYVPDLKAVAEMKVADIDGFLEGVAAFAAGPEGPADPDPTATPPGTDPDA